MIIKPCIFIKYMLLCIQEEESSYNKKDTFDWQNQMLSLVLSASEITSCETDAFII